MAVRVSVAGERALFARPEFRRDLISYDLITPHAARGILDTIYWRPGMMWVIDTIRVINPIQRECIEEDGRRILMLRNVAYLIDAHFELAKGEPVDSAARHAAMFKRVMRQKPDAYLGRAGCTATAALVDLHASEDGIATSLKTTNYGWLLHSIDFNDNRRPRFFRAQATGGLVRVPRADSPLLFC